MTAPTPRQNKVVAHPLALSPPPLRKNVSLTPPGYAQSKPRISVPGVVSTNHVSTHCIDTEPCMVSVGQCVVKIMKIFFLINLYYEYDRGNQITLTFNIIKYNIINFIFFIPLRSIHKVGWDHPSNCTWHSALALGAWRLALGTGTWHSALALALALGSWHSALAPALALGIGPRHRRLALTLG